MEPKFKLLQQLFIKRKKENNILFFFIYRFGVYNIVLTSTKYIDL